MFGMVRRKSHGMMARRDFEQGVEHLKAAATHAARGTGATVGPKLETARGRVQPAAGKVRNAASGSWESAIAALAPLAAAASEGARQAGRKTSKSSEKNAKKLDRKARRMVGRKKSSSKGKLIGLGIAGLALGAAGAMAMRKRQQQWDEYDPGQPIGAVGSESMPASMSPDPTGSTATSAATVTNEVDQTSSLQHSPTVAKMAGGESPS